MRGIGEVGESVVEVHHILGAVGNAGSRQILGVALAKLQVARGQPAARQSRGNPLPRRFYKHGAPVHADHQAIGTYALAQLVGTLATAAAHIQHVLPRPVHAAQGHGAAAGKTALPREGGVVAFDVRRRGHA